MQRLEVSCVVQRIYTSLGAKGLRKGDIYLNLLVEVTQQTQAAVRRGFP